jgi:hypothetical protein
MELAPNKEMKRIIGLGGLRTSSLTRARRGMKFLTQLLSFRPKALKVPGSRQADAYPGDEVDRLSRALGVMGDFPAT